MYQACGSITAQIQNVYNEEIQKLFNNYQSIERGEYYSKWGCIGSKSNHKLRNEIEMRCRVTIQVDCGYLMQAIRIYKKCQMCDGWGSYAGLNGYEWCGYCNVFHEVEA